jgi:hypothetical protein
MAWEMIYSLNMYTFVVTKYCAEMANTVFNDFAFKNQEEYLEFI